MHGTDSYSVVTWRKSGELNGSMISAVTVWFALLVIYSVQFYCPFVEPAALLLARSQTCSLKKSDQIHASS